MADAFGPIPPAPAADTFLFDFTAQIGTGGGIASADWDCAVEPASAVTDPSPSTRILGPPTFTTNQTSALCGNMIDGCLYLLTATVTTTDNRVLSESADVMCTSVQLPPDPSAPLTPDQFRLLFPAFADKTVYPDAMLQMWLNMAPLNQAVWGSMYQIGMGLWVGHELTKFGPGGLASSPGMGGIGIPASKSVNGVSISYDLNIGVDPEAGQYNMTLYGRQFWSMMKYLPIGPYQMGSPAYGWSWYPYPVMLWGGPWPITNTRIVGGTVGTVGSTLNW